MRIELKKFGEILTSRDSGREAFAVLELSLGDLTDNEYIEIDFEGVTVLTPSWADEVITPLFKRYGKRLKLRHTDNSSVRATLEMLDQLNNSGLL